MSWAAWLGLLALALNATLPVHLAYDLAVAFGPTHAAPAHTTQPLAGHEGHDRHHHHHNDQPAQPAHDHDKACQFCAAAVTLAGFAPASVAVLPTPPASALALVAPATSQFALKATPSAYRSRAPPVA